MPQRTINALVTIKTPMASLSVSPCNPVTNKAAPGVDHAVRTGTRYHNVRVSVLTPIASPSAVIQPEICAVEAPATIAACQIIAAELA